MLLIHDILNVWIKDNFNIITVFNTSFGNSVLGEPLLPSITFSSSKLILVHFLHPSHPYYCLLHCHFQDQRQMNRHFHDWNDHHHQQVQRLCDLFHLWQLIIWTSRLSLIFAYIILKILGYIIRKTKNAAVPWTQHNILTWVPPGILHQPWGESLVQVQDLPGACLVCGHVGCFHSFTNKRLCSSGGASS